MPARSHKTPQLMKLLTKGSSVTNPLLDEQFKEDIIRSRKNPRPVQPVPSGDGGVQINVTAELISQWLPLVMQRFNVCCCERCSAEASVEAYDAIRPVVVKVRSDKDLQRAAAIKKDKEKSVLMSLIAIMAKRRNLPVHQR